MAVDIGIPDILVLFHLCGDHADHPDNAKDMVGVLMSDENMVDVGHVHIHLFKDA